MEGPVGNLSMQSINALSLCFVRAEQDGEAGSRSFCSEPSGLLKPGDEKQGLDTVVGNYSTNQLQFSTSFNGRSTGGSRDIELVSSPTHDDTRWSCWFRAIIGIRIMNV